jgi:uncharacterized SAM-binding protein YcdF (DUF218 family)
LGVGFILKKLVSIFLTPLSIGILIISAGLYLLYRHKTIPARRLILAGILWLFLFSYGPVANFLLYQLEHRYPTLSTPSDGIAYIYVLGYGHTTDTTLPITSQVDKEAVVRLAEGIRLYHQCQGKAKLIVSGYSGLFDPTPHALMQQRLAQALGIPKTDIITVPEAKDTEEEAQAAKKLTQGKSFALVSSAYHLPRAMKFFKAAKLHTIPAPTYHQASLKNPNYLGFFSADALRKSPLVFHEFLGLVWQRVKSLPHTP